MAVADPIRAIRALLAADPDIAAAVGTRVFTGSVASVDMALDDNGRPTQLVVLVNAAGGLPSTGYITPRVDVRVYGPSELEAREVWWQAHHVLKHLDPCVVNGVRLHSVTPEALPTARIEPEPGNWPVTWGSFLVRAQEELVA